MTVIGTGTKQLSREALYEEVWTDPVTIVATRYGLSDVGLAKICKKLNIPLPRRGYWAMIKAGRVMRRMPLPKIAGGQSLNVGLVRLSPEQLARHTSTMELNSKIRQTVSQILVPGELIDPLPLIKATSKRLRQRDGWNDEKGLRAAPDEVLHLVVTHSVLDRALRIMDTLIKELAKFSVNVRIDVNKKRTVLDIEGTLISLMISEFVSRTSHVETPSEKKARDRYYSSWRLGSPISSPHIPRYDFHPTGVLTITAGTWPSRTWKDTPKTQLEDRLGQVVAGILTLAKEIYEKNLEDARKEEDRRRTQERYEAAKDRFAREEERFKDLERNASRWKQATKLRSYIDAVERHATQTGNDSPDLRAWIVWARAKADWVDPLILVSDPILDAPKPKKPGYY